MGLDFSAFNKGLPVEDKGTVAEPSAMVPEKSDNGNYQQWLEKQDEIAIKIQEAAEEKKQIAAMKKQKKEGGNKQLLDVAKIINRNLQRGGALVYDLNKAINKDCPPEQVALLAVKCVSLLINEGLIYNNIAKRYEEKYGIALTDGFPFKVITTK